MVIMMKMLEKVEIPLAAAPAGFPLQPSLLQPLFLCFGVSAVPSSRKPYRVIYIGDLCQTESVDERIGRNEGGWRAHPY
jgi:hypothetical protein